MSRKYLGLITLCSGGALLTALLGHGVAAEVAAGAPSASMLPKPAPGTPAMVSPIISPLPATLTNAPASDARQRSAQARQSADNQARGVVRAVNEATLSSNMLGQIIKMPFSEGSAFKKGDLLVEFNCDRGQAELRAAEAAMQVEEKTVETNQELERFNSVGKFDVLISVSKLNKAKAEVEALQAQIKQCKVFAPFSGRVTERMTHLYESVSVSEPLLRIIDTTTLELDLIVPSKWLQWLKPGTAFTFQVDETGQTLSAVVDRLLPSVDPVSKTVKIIGRFAANRGGVAIPGMSGTATFAKEGNGQ